MDLFGPIPPAPASDSFVFDFTAQLGSGGATITAATWLCSVDPTSPVIDPTPAQRILGTPTYSATKTSALVGSMVNGCLYVLQAQVQTSDSRTLTDQAGVQCTSVEPVPDPSQPLTIDQFRAILGINFPNPPYTDAMLQMWVSLCPIQYCVWGGQYQFGQALWVAHELTKLGPNGLASGNAGTGVSGLVSSKGVGPVNVSYDNELGSEDGAGQYNLTIYGRQFWSLARLLPVGPMQIGAASIPPGGWFNQSIPVGGAWSGPWPAPAIAGFSS
jgi:hypothetical protein